ncbi:MAG: Chaperone protein HscC [Stenotrophomonas maltophilia]|uniref:Chaperone protein HscC n=1 Tax=Stenotrophomonas maltophilia TaxID=40324 RepID=A0A7V8JK60_STEMA|nr:MAG: Chaperone protein HscC [Stenotrophomonas maltophilia]
MDRNIKLDEIRIPLKGKGPASEKGVTTRFTYDINGLLQVEVTEHASGQRHELILEQNPGLLSPQEIQQRLAALQDLKINPRDAQPNLAVVARLEHLYEEYLDQRETLQDWLSRFRSVLETQDTGRIERDREELIQSLDVLERDA